MKAKKVMALVLCAAMVSGLAATTLCLLEKQKLMIIHIS